MKKIIFVSSFVMAAFGIMAFQPAFAIGFSAGNEFQATLIEGNLTVFCPGTNGTTQSRFSCRAGILDPAEYDYFVGPTGRGESVTLTVTREDGSSRTKTSDYDGQTGKSKSRFNLWVSSLTQRPLLADGKNIVSYVIITGKDRISEGSFVVQVRRQPTAVCSPGIQNAPTGQDCQNQYSACGRYFEERNYCQ